MAERSFRAAAREAAAAGRAATSREEILPDAASDDFCEAKIRHGIFRIEHYAQKAGDRPAATEAAPMSIEFLDHTADVGVRISAASPAELLAEAVRAFHAVLLEEGGADLVEIREERAVAIDGPDGETLLVDLLNRLIYHFDAERLLLPVLEVAEASLRRGAARVRGRLRGERYDPARHAFSTAVKAATYHGLEIVESGGRLTAEVIFDL
jgi:protein archease